MRKHTPDRVTSSTLRLNARSDIGSRRPLTVSPYVNISRSGEGCQTANDARNATDSQSPALASADPLATVSARSAAMPSTALDAALVLIDKLTAAGISPRLTPIYATKATRCEPWNTGDRTRDDVLRHRAEYRRAIGVGDASGLLVAIDPDNEAAELVAAELIGDCATFRIASPRGEHRVFLRGDVLPADLRANLVYSNDRPAEALAHKLDVVAGCVTLYRNDKTWLTDPAMIAPMPDRLRDAVAACWSAQQQREAETRAATAARAAEAERQRQARGDQPGNADRLRRWSDATLASIPAEAATRGRGSRRRDALGGGAKRLARLTLNGWTHATTDDVEAAMMDAAHRNGYVADHGLRAALSHVRRGIRAGLAAGPLPEPADRDLVRASLPPDRLREIERRAAAAADVLVKIRAFNATLPPKHPERIHPARAEVCRRMADELAQRCVDEGRIEVAVSYADLGTAIDCDKATVSRAAQAMQALGWSIVTGRLGADGRATATIWRLPIAQKPVTAAYPHDATLCRESLQAVGSASESTLDKPRCIVRISPPGLLVRGLRRKLVGHASALRTASKRSDGRQAAELARLDATLIELDPTITARSTACSSVQVRHVDGLLSGCGPAAYRLLPALAAAADLMTVAELADRAGCGNDSARRFCARVAERGMVTVGTVRTAGRSAAGYRLTAEAAAAVAGEHVADPTPILAATIEVGAQSIRRAQARIDAERSLLADARQQAQALGVITPAMLAGIMSQIRRMAAAERDADLGRAHSPIIADARRKVRRERMTEIQHRRTAERCGLAWAMNAQAVPAW